MLELNYYNYFQFCFFSTFFLKIFLMLIHFFLKTRIYALSFIDLLEREREIEEEKKSKIRKKVGKKSYNSLIAFFLHIIII
jgi:hypothetical protein